jgi:DNA-binding transcriptional ArsR family regulator
VPGDADLAAIGRMLGDDHRARFLLALLGGEALPAGELAARSGASSSLASAHLAKLLDAGLVDATRRGRQRHYRLATPQVAHAIEALLAVAPARATSSLREHSRGEAIRRARTCYDHVAGRLGVAVADAFEERCIVRANQSGWELTPHGEHELEQLGLDIPALRRQRRAFIRPCLDWTERRPHIAGGLGAAVTARMFELAWIRRLPGSRGLRVTPKGDAELHARFAVSLEPPASDGRRP